MLSSAILLFSAHCLSRSRSSKAFLISKSAMALPPRAGALDAFALYRMGQIEQRISEHGQLLKQHTGRLKTLEKI